MNLEKLFEMQKELDAHIEDQHPRWEGESRQPKKVLALLVELAELANETRCFKFWSNKGPSEREVILEEFSDGVHFLLSLGLEMKVEKFEIAPMKKDTLTEQFIDLFGCFSRLVTHWSENNYSTSFSAYVGLGELFGFTWEEVEEAYIAKNEINHKRQEESY